MSKADIERFSNDVKTNKKLQEEVKAKATSIRSLVEVAKAQGYDFSAQEVQDYVRAQGKELSDEQLDAVTGGRIPIVVILPTALIVISGTVVGY
jgi:predicted ribosomally synthesized peptide with nif11-like leader